MRHALNTTFPGLRQMVDRMGELMALSRHDIRNILALRYGLSEAGCASSSEISRQTGLDCFVVRGLLRQAWQKLQKEHPDAISDPAKVVAHQLSTQHKLHIALAEVARHPYFSDVATPEVALASLIHDMASYAGAEGPRYPRVIRVSEAPLATFVPEILTGKLRVTDVEPISSFSADMVVPKWALQAARDVALSSLGCIRQDFLMFTSAIAERHTGRACSMLTHRLGIDDGRALSLEEVGDLYDVTRERARKSCQDAARDIMLVESLAGWGPVSTIADAMRRVFPNTLPAIVFMEDLPELDDYFQQMAGNARGLFNMLSAYGFQHLVQGHGLYINGMDTDKQHATAILKSVESMERAVLQARGKQAGPQLVRMSVTITDDMIKHAKQDALARRLAGDEGATANDVYADVLAAFLADPCELGAHCREVQWDQRGNGWSMINIFLPRAHKLEIAAVARKRKISRSSLVNAVLEARAETAATPA